MKKKILGFAAVALLTIGLAACGSSNDSASSDSSSKEKNNTLVVGASPTPHAEILEHVKPLLEKEGVNLEIKKFDDYVLPNKALADKDIDANYFQHKPFFDKAVKENDYKFTDAGAIHIEPMGLYSKKIKDIKDLKDGATIITSSSESDWGRIITILQDAGLVKVKEGVDLETATFDDIAENPKKLKFDHSIDPALLATTYSNDEGDLVAINANFAYGAGLNPVKDSVLLEKDTSPYANIIAVRTADKDDDRIKKLIKVLHEKDVQDWILEKWDGSVKPVEK
ncbi:MetQ/NlpA family ABC transporter substrate-binding protein [Enterococcus pseudoavium]|uniref:Lipoprotein n=1 Tax=Enterococcus pseudoavium TaxID=44007 RepID=A0AAE4L1U4_9ENTE|nr:MetQ/NlpA family ABC transporter substrate-binding protein [Enterococcus pseudoavium]MDT2737161.1 MetQ/NlpA family ABC transporter substrate-binding protein [Enterococcus pseudoavium]MDT2753294.1 MetQ/NlpA family ABC transporter substrate-binding protein [Enterococcus pseudoavium]MDT2769621.1 MetQ/NlpA family ABC transporter substrate-binding protein [Enterococcus pseudoavium]REC32167.1 methionine ABC transporter substrate-binding protein [Enterococcus pseudoavium]